MLSSSSQAKARLLLAVSADVAHFDASKSLAFAWLDELYINHDARFAFYHYAQAGTEFVGCMSSHENAVLSKRLFYKGGIIRCIPEKSSGGVAGPKVTPLGKGC